MMKLGSFCLTVILSIPIALMVSYTNDAAAQMTFSVEEYMVHEEGAGLSLIHI